MAVRSSHWMYMLTRDEKHATPVVHINVGKMLTNFYNSFTVGLSNKFAAKFLSQYYSHRTLSVSLHYLVKLKC